MSWSPTDWHTLGSGSSSGSGFGLGGSVLGTVYSILDFDDHTPDNSIKSGSAFHPLAQH